MNENGGPVRRENVSAVRLTKVGGVLNAGKEPALEPAVDEVGKVKGHKAP